VSGRVAIQEYAPSKSGRRLPVHTPALRDACRCYTCRNRRWQTPERRAEMSERVRWAKQTIILATTDGPSPVDAAVFGAWAVHAPILADGALHIHWAVTHAPTGLSVGTGFEKSRAKKLCQQLHRIVGDTPITGQGMPGIEPEMRRQILRAVAIAHGYSEIEAEAEPPLPRAEATP
jgi:hypothetical protein